MLIGNYTATTPCVGSDLKLILRQLAARQAYYPISVSYLIHPLLQWLAIWSHVPSSTTLHTHKPHGCMCIFDILIVMFAFYWWARISAWRFDILWKNPVLVLPIFCSCIRNYTLLCSVSASPATRYTASTPIAEAVGDNFIVIGQVHQQNIRLTRFPPSLLLQPDHEIHLPSLSFGILIYFLVCYFFSMHIGQLMQQQE